MPILFPTGIPMERKHLIEEGCPIFRGALLSFHTLDNRFEIMVMGLYKTDASFLVTE